MQMTTREADVARLMKGVLPVYNVLKEESGGGVSLNHLVSFPNHLLTFSAPHWKTVWLTQTGVCRKLAILQRVGVCPSFLVLAENSYTMNAREDAPKRERCLQRRTKTTEVRN